MTVYIVTILTQLITVIKETLTHKKFWTGFVICFAIFSHYIFGPDNLLEQIGEKLVQDDLEVDVDFSARDKNNNKN